MWITAREACRALALAGVSQRCALRVLGAGLAGGAMRTSNAVLYDKARVIELAQRPTVSWTELDEPCPAGFFVSRREFPATASRERQLASLCSGWGSVCPWNWVCLDHQIGRYGSFPFVATVG